jgi:hypothetical protein
LALSCSSAFGSFTGGIFFDNTDNTSLNPLATTNGLVWINSGSGPVWLNQDINMELLCGTSAGTLAQLTNLNYDGNPLDNGPQYSTWLLSVGTADGIGTFFGDGQFIDPYGDEWVTYQTPTSGASFDFQILAWTGNYNTYAAAYAASASGTPGIYVGETPVFLQATATGIGIPPDMVSMPALILARAVPEPSTLFLTAAGLVGLLAYAWRKRK